MRKKYNEKMLDYLEEKYGESFDIYENTNGFRWNSIPELFCTREGTSDYLIYVQYNPATNWWRDNYICVRYADKINAKLADVLKQILPGIKCAYLPYDPQFKHSDESLTKDSSFEECAKTSAMGIGITAFVEIPSEGIDKEKIAEAAETAILESGMFVQESHFYFTSDFVNGETITYGQLAKMLASRSYKEFLFLKMSDELKIERKEWMK